MGCKLSTNRGVNFYSSKKKRGVNFRINLKVVCLPIGNIVYKDLQIVSSSAIK